ncbi:hypothetical protein D3C78_1035260 [compost metagenome]
MAGLRTGITHMHNIIVLVEGQRAGNINHAIGKGSRRKGSDGFAGTGRHHDLLRHFILLFVFLNQSVTGAACEITPQKSLTVATQPKNFSTL